MYLKNSQRKIKKCKLLPFKNENGKIDLFYDPFKKMFYAISQYHNLFSQIISPKIPPFPYKNSPLKLILVILTFRGGMDGCSWKNIFNLICMVAENCARFKLLKPGWCCVRHFEIVRNIAAFKYKNIFIL